MDLKLMRATISSGRGGKSHDEARELGVDERERGKYMDISSPFILHESSAPSKVPRACQTPHDVPCH